MCIIVLFSGAIFAQKENAHWFFYYSNGLSFKNGFPEKVSGSAYPSNSQAGNASISDKKTGELLFYSDGLNVWNRKNDTMQNGAKLFPGSSVQYPGNDYYQNVLIVPHPNNPQQFFLFSGKQGVMYYCVVDMSKGEGRVIQRNKVLSAKSNHIDEIITGTIDCSGTGYWITIPSSPSKADTLFSFHATKNGIDTIPVVSLIDTKFSHQFNNILFSPDSKHLAYVQHGRLDSTYIVLMDFDNRTGRFSNPKRFGGVGDGVFLHGLCFSQDSKKVYVYTDHANGNYLRQYDISSNNEQIIEQSVYYFDAFKGYSQKEYDKGLQLAIDGKIYLFHRDSLYMTLAEIAHPNEAGVNAEFRLRPDLATYPKDQQLLGMNLTNQMTFWMRNVWHYDTVCKGESIRIGIEKGTSHTYSWKLNDQELSRKESSINVTPDTTCVYTLSDDDLSASCYPEKVTNYYYHVTVIPKAKAILEKDSVYVCKGEKVQLKVTGGTFYRWQPKEGLSNPNVPDPMFVGTKTMNYTVVSYNTYCSDSAKLSVVVVPLPKAEAGKNQSICYGGKVRIGTSNNPEQRYSWFPTEGLSNSTLSEPIASPLVTTKYYLTVSTGGSCIAKDSVLITVRNQPVVVTKDTTICRGQSVRLSASGGERYEWVPSTGLDNAFSANPTATPKQTIRYKVRAITADCIDSAYVTVSVIRVADAGNDKTLCAGLSTQLGTPRQADCIYSWSPTDYLDNPNIAQPLCTPLKDIRYILTVNNAEGCSDSDTVDIKIGGELSVYAGKDTSICAGMGVQLQAEGAESYEWSPSEGLNNSNISNPVATPTKTMTYHVRGKNGNCEGRDSITITVVDKPELLISENKMICVGESVQLNVNGAEEYEWSPSEGLNKTDISNPIATPNKTILYYVTGKNGNCESKDSVLITVKEKPELIISGNREICLGESVELQVHGAESYEWSPSEGLNRTDIYNPTATPSKTTTYYVKGTSGTCEDKDSITITVNPKPEITISNDTTICLGERVQLFANGAESYEWSPTEYLDNSFIANPISKPEKSIVYTVKGKQGNCSVTDTVTITVRPETTHTITISADTTQQYTPGTKVRLFIAIPSGFETTGFSLKYDECCVMNMKVISSTIAYTAQEKSGSIHFATKAGEKQGGTIELECEVVLPPDGRLYEKFEISEVLAEESCLMLNGTKVTIPYDPSCAWNIRGVLGTEKFDVRTDGEKVYIYTGIGGRTKVSIYNMRGEEVWQVENDYTRSSEIEIPLPDLSGGVFILRVQNYNYKTDVVLVK